MIKGLVFDKDGTLLDYEAFWLPVARHAVRALIEQSDLPDTPEEPLLRHIGAYDGIAGVLCYGTYAMIADAMNKALAEQGIRFSADTVAEAFRQSVAGGNGAVAPTCDDIASVMNALRARGLTLALVTSDNRALTELSLDALGIRAYFSVLYTDDGIHPAKPDPYYMRKFCETYGFAPDEVLMVGDTLTDMRFAENSGVRAIGVAKRAEDAAIIAPKAYTVLHDVSGVPAFVDSLNGADA